MTRAPRLDAIVAPEKSFFKPSVDREIGISTVLGHYSHSLPPRSLLPCLLCPPDSSYNSAKTRQRQIRRRKEEPFRTALPPLPAAIPSPSHLLHTLVLFHSGSQQVFLFHWTRAGCQAVPGPCPRQMLRRCWALPDPRLPWPQGHSGHPPSPLPAPAERDPAATPRQSSLGHSCHGFPVSVRTPQARSPYPGWHGLTFPEDVVHAVQGMGIAGRSERGRCQGPRLPSPPAAPPPRAGSCRSRARSPPPVRCCPPAATRTPGPGSPGPSRPPSPLPQSLTPPFPAAPAPRELRSPTHLRRREGGCFTSFCIL